MKHIICAALMLALVATTALAGNGISVYGSAEASVTPDLVVWQAIVKGKDKNLHKAKQQCDEQVDELLQALEILGVAHADRRLGRMSINQVWKKGEGSNQKLSHYSVERGLVIMQHDLARLEEFFDALMIERGLSARMNFKYSRQDEEMDRLRVAALANARTKAGVLARIVEAELGAALEISEFPLTSTRRYDDALMVKAPSHRSLDPNEIKLRVKMFATFALKERESPAVE